MRNYYLCLGLLVTTCFGVSSSRPVVTRPRNNTASAHTKKTDLRPTKPHHENSYHKYRFPPLASDQGRTHLYPSPDSIPASQHLSNYYGYLGQFEYTPDEKYMIFNAVPVWKQGEKEVNKLGLYVDWNHDLKGEARYHDIHLRYPGYEGTYEVHEYFMEQMYGSDATWHVGI